MPIPMGEAPQAAAPPTPAGPQGAPMAQPSPNDGANQMGLVQLETAMQMIERALGSIPAGPEHDAAIKALSALSKVVNRQQQEDLVPAQLAELMRTQQTSPMQQIMGGGGAPQQAQPMAQ